MKTLKTITNRKLIIGAIVATLITSVFLFVLGMHVGKHFYHWLNS